MLLAFVGLIALINGLFGWLGPLVGIEELSLELILGNLFAPAAFLLGVPWSEALVAGNLIGQKLVLNEFVAFGSFATDKELLTAAPGTDCAARPARRGGRVSRQPDECGHRILFPCSRLNRP